MVEKSRIIYYEGLGDILVTINPRARRFIFRVRDNQLQMTSPKFSSKAEQLKAIEQMKDRLLHLLKSSKEPLIDLNFKIETDYFKLTIVEGNRDRFMARSELGELTIIAPLNSNFEDEQLQAWLKKVVVEALRRNAKIIFPPRLYELSKRYQIPYQQLRINTSVGRWGSCSTKKSINLSAYLILLPEHLIDYVMKHELAHIKEMNHSPQFWSHLDSLTKGQAQALNDELKHYRTSIFTSL